MKNVTSLLKFLAISTFIFLLSSWYIFIDTQKENKVRIKNSKEYISYEEAKKLLKEPVLSKYNYYKVDYEFVEKKRSWIPFKWEEIDRTKETFYFVEYY